MSIAVESSPPQAFVEHTIAKLQSDKQRRLQTLWLAREWQGQRVEARSAVAETTRQALLALRPALPRVDPFLQDALDEASLNLEARRLAVVRLSMANIAHSTGQEVVLADLSPAGDGPDALILKVGETERIKQESLRLQWAAGLLGEKQVPRAVLAAAPVERGDVSALLLEPVCLKVSERGGALRRTGLLTSLTDLLHVGSLQHSLEDARTAACVFNAKQQHTEEVALQTLFDKAGDLAQFPEILQEIPRIRRQLAQQAAGVLKRLADEATPPDAGGDLATELVSLTPCLERHLLRGQRPTTASSPLHEHVRELTEGIYHHLYGKHSDTDGSAAKTIAELLADAGKLRDSLETLRAAERDRQEQRSTAADSCKPPVLLAPKTLSHNDFSTDHLLVRPSVDAAGLDLCVTSWRRCRTAPVFFDLATMLTSMAFEAVRLPMPLVYLRDLFAAVGAEAGLGAQSAVVAQQFGISEATATRLCVLLKENDILFAERPIFPAEVLQQLVQEAEDQAGKMQKGGSGVDGSDIVWLLASLRGGDPVETCAPAAAEARKISESLCDWKLPSYLVKQQLARRADPKGGVPRLGVPRPPPRPPAGRAGCEVAVRATQWGWQTVREFRDSAVPQRRGEASAVPLGLEGHVSELWPALWLTPSLQKALVMLELPSLPWMQKVWLLYHISMLIRRLNSWLERLLAGELTTEATLEVRCFT
eukprot:TRINITY_DN35485_c0_g2_i1.p1 TRINITY_DN35485_c0_g2~~TRINITY_DN35485_c0_g2_i1.p1  ORF type:complete len:707 (-),score=99.65 TRINITY_DN35485_c0_g2_i1:55-2175(-)